jgi:nicotinate-nucleotide--dimethylbenzimidazole phosphoribosyltransferase
MVTIQLLCRLSATACYSSSISMTQSAHATLRITPELLQRRLDTRTKPQGSLGQLELLAIRIGVVLQAEQPRFSKPCIMVFAGDHGIAREGVSAYPQDVTAQMVANYLAGGAAINVLARQHGLALSVVNAGVAATLQAVPGLIDCSLGAGTRDATREPAMSAQECAAAIDGGRRLAAQAIAAGSNALLLGEMGIGNTASASLLLHRLTGWPLAECVGRGTGLDDAGLARKRCVLERASARIPQQLEPLAILQEFGGFELAMLVGAILECAQHRCLAVIDGFAVSVCTLLAERLEPNALDHCVFSHCSAEHAHRALLQDLGRTPLLDLDLRLGEATGAALAWPLLEASVRLMSDMASFESAGVSDRS